MKQNEKVIEVLNDLIRINNDRIAGYEKAAKEVQEATPDLHNIFYKTSTESRSFVNELHVEVIRLGGAPVTRVTIAGKIYLFWLDLNIVFGGKDAHTILAACESGEDAVQQVYQKALDAAEDFPISIIRLIANQQFALQRTHDTIKRYRDAFSVPAHQ